MKRLNLGDSVSLGELLLALVVSLVTGGIAWGSAMQRIKTLEEKAQGWSGLDARLTRVETKVDGITGDISEIKGDVKQALQELRSFSPSPRGRL